MAPLPRELILSNGSVDNLNLSTQPQLASGVEVDTGTIAGGKEAKF